ncbi:MAG: RdgB/HAM1 family non-canonical purine NTP pyrophosphatase [Castellaniella sp.]|uniref:RdgB/HAM1 family non-canonical purine NTP pyrophosphatase n=1 Tax=Castellaniella sp. TaxID=1955812 RepID=UPI00121FC46C|nr:RdgB/HAM1 family non-canonical purine NTP pyrophosphatase [Castellaniella sp.]TAN30420.1 MAG: RdgB/HAM1 family non-canonical purine NTP pyrophosphatase [Castellaniella sp.]
MNQRVVLASNNPGKLREFSAILGAAGIEMVAQGTLGVTEAAEPYLTFVENALAKARHASQATGLPALADDSGLCVRGLGGAPGVHSARYAVKTDGTRSDADNNARLVSELSGIADRRGSYVAVLVYVRSADDPRPIVVEGVWDGEVLDTPRGDQGFGYDPYFFLPDLGKTAAELSLAQKNQVSHRARALQGLLRSLRGLFDDGPGQRRPDQAGATPQGRSDQNTR